MQLKLAFKLVGGGRYNVGGQAEHWSRLLAAFNKDNSAWLCQAYVQRRSNRAFEKECIRRLRKWLRQIQRELGQRLWRSGRIVVREVIVTVCDANGNTLALIGVRQGTVWWPSTK